ncbi:hypothetical protein Vadar_011668 [Vaccinium darrowii]|uniref:Uncharacterized protein n=1 Tax=Vaccinium darrowii TaxID=229202 RepID=A0ACB7XHD5_9ERIC|nr:hypothetical protein Vadar_011668 [Vaccinium darrowii]
MKELASKRLNGKPQPCGTNGKNRDYGLVGLRDAMGVGINGNQLKLHVGRNLERLPKISECLLGRKKRNDKDWIPSEHDHGVDQMLGHGLASDGHLPYGPQQWGWLEVGLEKLRAPVVGLPKDQYLRQSWASPHRHAIGHGIPDSYLDKVREVAKQFFLLPVEEKKKYSHGVKDGEGYGGDLIVSEKQVLDWSDRLVLKVLPEDERRPNL